MKKSWLLVAAALGSSALPGCEDNPDGFYKTAPPGAGDRWNDGETRPIDDPYARNGFKDEFNAASKQELCSGPVKQKRWAAMVAEPIKPPLNIAGLDLRGGEAWTGLDFRDAEKVNCQSKAVSGDGATITAGWGDAYEVMVDYKLSNNTIESYVLNQGYRGTLDFESRPTDIDDPKKPNPYGIHKYSIGIGRPVFRDGRPYELNWKKACDPNRPDIMDCWEKQATELFDALMYTYEPGLQSTQKSCVKEQSCLAKTYSTGDAVFGVRPLGIYMYVDTINQPQPVPSTPKYLYGFYTKLMPFSGAELFLKLDEEGPTATSKGLGDRKVDCIQRLGISYGEYLDKCVNVLKDSSKNKLTLGKLLGGMTHTKEAFDFAVEGVVLDFLSSAIGDDKTVGDADMPSSKDEAYEFNMDIRATGNVRNEYSQDGTTFTFGGTGAIYREYARRVQEDIHKQMAEWPNSVKNPQNGKCEGGWDLKSGDGKCHYKGFEIGDPACLMPDGAGADWKPAPGCTGFEGFITPGSHTEAPNTNVAKVSVGARAQGMGFKTALRAGDPIALFCIDPSPNPKGQDTGAECTDNNQCWSNHCLAQMDAQGKPTGKKACDDVQNYYFHRCDIESGGLTGSLLDGSWQRVMQYLGGDQKDNLPPALQDRKYYFRHWAHAIVKYLKAATLFPTDLNALGPTACGGFSCDPEPDHLIFDQVAQFSDRDNFEYIDKRFVSHDREPLKIEYEILINSSNQQQWRFHRKMTRGERALYRAMSLDRKQPPAAKEDNLRITNLVGSPVIQGMGFRGVNAAICDLDKEGMPVAGCKDAHYCASTLIDGAPDPECAARGSVPPKNSLTGEYMKDGYGDPILKRYRGAFTGTPFSMGTTYLQVKETLPFIQSATVHVPMFANPYNPEAAAQTKAAAAPEAPLVLLDWRPKTPANGIRIPVNAQRDKFIPSWTAGMSGASLDFGIDYELLPGGIMKVHGVQAKNFHGYLFLCQDPVTRDVLAVEPYESTEVIKAWKIAHPGAFDACEIIVRPSAYNNDIPISIAAKKAGLLLNVGIGSGVGRVTTVEFFDTSLL